MVLLTRLPALTFPQLLLCRQRWAARPAPTIAKCSQSSRLERPLGINLRRASEAGNREPGHELRSGSQPGCDECRNHDACAAVRHIFGKLVRPTAKLIHSRPNQ